MVRSMRCLKGYDSLVPEFLLIAPQLLALGASASSAGRDDLRIVDHCSQQGDQKWLVWWRGAYWSYKLCCLFRTQIIRTLFKVISQVKLAAGYRDKKTWWNFGSTITNKRCDTGSCIITMSLCQFQQHKYNYSTLLSISKIEKSSESIVNFLAC